MGRPVGLCAVINAVEHKPKNILAVDLVPSRLDLAKGLGAETWNSQTDREGLEERVKGLTDGRGADAVIGIWTLPDCRIYNSELMVRGAEVVGLSPALRIGFDLLRPWGESLAFSMWHPAPLKV